MTTSGFGGFSLKTVGDRFVGFGPQNLREDLGATHGIIRELASRQSMFMKGLWLSNARNSTWAISSLWLGGSGKISRCILGLYNMPINKARGYQGQLSLPPKLFG